MIVCALQWILIPHSPLPPVLCPVLFGTGSRPGGDSSQDKRLKDGQCAAEIPINGTVSFSSRIFTLAMRMKNEFE